MQGLPPRLRPLTSRKTNWPWTSGSQSQQNHPPPTSSQTSPVPPPAVGLAPTVPPELVSLLAKFENAIRAEMNVRILALEEEVLRLSTSFQKLEYGNLPSSRDRWSNRNWRLESQVPHQSLQPHSRVPSISHPSTSTRRGLSNTLPFRIVWGTPRSCSSQVIKKAICALLPNSLWERFEIKKSLRQRGPRWIWWYTIIAPNEVITMIDQVWHSLEAKTSWSLRSSLANRSSSSHQQVSSHLHNSAVDAPDRSISPPTSMPPEPVLTTRPPQQRL